MKLLSKIMIPVTSLALAGTITPMVVSCESGESQKYEKFVFDSDFEYDAGYMDPAQAPSTLSELKTAYFTTIRNNHKIVAQEAAKEFITRVGDATKMTISIGDINPETNNISIKVKVNWGDKGVCNVVIENVTFDLSYYKNSEYPEENGWRAEPLFYREGTDSESMAELIRQDEGLHFSYSEKTSPDYNVDFSYKTSKEKLVSILDNFGAYLGFLCIHECEYLKNIPEIK